MASFNRVIFMGNLTRDPEVRYTPQGTPVATLGLAVNNRVKQGDEWKDEPCFIDVAVFGKQAESCGEYLSKGRSVLIEGRLRYRTWESQDGQKRSKHEVLADRVQFLPRAARMTEGGLSGEMSEGEPVDDDDVPF
jgi:single-strand DNA-binding protein